MFFIAPYVIDWNDYKASLVRVIEKQTGRSARVDGDIRITFLPIPTIHVEDVSLGNLPHATEPTMVTFSLLSARLALGSLLRGTIEAHALQLEEPVIHLQRFPDGSDNWTFTPHPTLSDQGIQDPESGKDDGSAGDTVAPARDIDHPDTDHPDTDHPDTASPALDPMIPLAISDIHIRDGRIFYHDPAGGVFALKDIDVDMAAHSIRGPFTGDATWSIHTVPVALNFEVDAVTLDQPFAIDLTMGLPDAGGQAQLRGSVDLSGSRSTGPQAPAYLKFSGRTELTGPSLSSTVTTLMVVSGFSGQNRPAFTPYADHMYEITGDLAVDGDDLTLNDMMIRFADFRASGGVNARLGDAPEIDLAVAFGRLDLDSFLEMISLPDDPVEVSATRDNQQTQSGGGDAVDDKVVDDGVIVRANLISPAVLYRGKPIRDVVADVVFSGRLVRLGGLQAHFPGGGRFDLSGALDVSATPATLEGDIAFRSDNLRPDLQWLGLDVDAIPGDRLRNFSIEAHLKGDRENLEFSDINFRFDQSKGRAAAVIAAGERPGLGLSFNIDGIDMDAYRSQKSHDKKPAVGDRLSGSGLSGDGLPGSGLSLSGNWLDVGFDANMRGRIGSIRLGGFPARELSLDVSFDRESLTFREVSFDDFAGLKTVINGRIDGSDLLPKLNLSLNAISTDFGDSFKRLGGMPSSLMQRLGAVTVNADLAGGVNELRYDGTIQAGGGQLALDGVVRSLILSPKIEASLKAHFPSFVESAGLLFPGYRPAGGDLGSLRVAGQLAGDFETLNFSKVKAQLGSVALRGQGSLDLTQDTPHMRAEIDADEIILDPFFPDSPATRRQGSLDSPSPLLIKTGTGGAARNTGSRWSRTPYNFSALRDLRMDIVLSGQSLGYGSYHVASPKVNVTSDGRLFRLAPVSGSLFGGAIGLEVDLAVDSVPHIQAMLSWQGADIGTALKHFGHADSATGALDLTLDLSGKGENTAALISSLKGQAQTIIRDPVLRGVDLAAIGQRLNDSRGVTGLLDVLRAASAGGHTSFETIEGNFVINNGVITGQPIELISDAGTGIIRSNVHLPRYVLDIDGQFSLASPANAPPLAAKMRGPLDRPTYQFVTKGIEEYLLKRGVDSLLDQFLPGFSGQPKSQSEPVKGGATGQPPPPQGASAPPSEENEPALPPAGRPSLPDIKDELLNVLDQLLP